MVLREIGIKNFILIEDLRLELDKGLNVLTGETGAGKSIVFDALGLLLGERFKSEQIRQGSEKSSVDGTFDAPRQREFQTWWADHDFEKSEEILIRREGYPDGRSKAYLNDQPVTLGTLQELGEFLVDVHGQNEHQNILKPSVQQALLDRFAGLEAKAATIEPLYRTWKDLKEKQAEGQLSEQERAQRIDVYRFQLEEIEKARLKAGEEADLSARLPELKNAEKLRVLANTAYDLLYQEEGSALEKLGQAAKSFEGLRHLAPSVEPLLNEVLQSKSRLEEAALALQHMAENWQADPAALEELLGRQDLLSRLKKKYGETLEAVIAHGEHLRAELDRLENTDTYRKELEKACQKARAELEEACQALSQKRKKAAKELGAAVQKELADLGLKQAIFRCQVFDLPSPLAGDRAQPNPHNAPSPDSLREGGRRPDEGTPHPSPLPQGERGINIHGMDQTVFEWAPNPGEGIQPLKAIASGGEMSRVMLALKSVLADADAVPTLVFDEIDAGIGGLTAQAVGKKLRALARHHQILCVSHLPQIASCAAAHFQVSKRVSKSRTFALVTRLEPEERVNELARLLGSQLTPTSVQHAKELLTQNQR